MRDVTTGKTTLVDTARGSATRKGNNSAKFPAVSRDGHYGSFHSTASDLVARDTNGNSSSSQPDVLVSQAVDQAPGSRADANFSTATTRPTWRSSAPRSASG